MLPRLPFRPEGLVFPVTVKCHCSGLTAEPPSRDFLQQRGASFLKVKNFPGAALIEYLVNTVMQESDSSCSTSGHLKKAIPGPEFWGDLLGSLLEPYCNGLFCPTLLPSNFTIMIAPAFRHKAPSFKSLSPDMFSKEPKLWNTPCYFWNYELNPHTKEDYSASCRNVHPTNLCTRIKIWFILKFSLKNLLRKLSVVTSLLLKVSIGTMF